MRWIIERLFGWDEVREDKNFAQFFKLDEARIMASNRPLSDKHPFPQGVNRCFKFSFLVRI
jgi:hypothetical protein